jgi:hypothetical protein
VGPTLLEAHQAGLNVIVKVRRSLQATTQTICTGFSTSMHQGTSGLVAFMTKILDLLGIVPVLEVGLH